MPSGINKSIDQFSPPNDHIEHKKDHFHYSTTVELNLAKMLPFISTHKTKASTVGGSNPNQAQGPGLVSHTLMGRKSA